MENGRGLWTHLDENKQSLETRIIRIFGRIGIALILLNILRQATISQTNIYNREKNGTCAVTANNATEIIPCPPNMAEVPVGSESRIQKLKDGWQK